MVGTPRLAWEVLVELVPGAFEDLRDVVVRRATLDIDLPGVAGLRLTMGRLGDRLVLVGLEPIVTGSTVVAPPGTGPAPTEVPLAVALLALGRPVPVLATGTVLQRAVLAALVAVPAGTTVTYGELAVRAGARGAARAAARAIATNPVPLVLPCHRVVPAAGGIGAYGWGSEVKAALLALEGAGVPAGRRAPAAVIR